MGRAKANLPWGDQTLLESVVRCVSQTVNAIVVVAAQDQTLPQLEPNVIIARDEQEYEGPLLGIERGLRELLTLPTPPAAAFVTSCDVPNLNPRFVSELFSLLQENDIVVPRDDRFFHPLAAVYRVGVHESVRRLVETGSRRPRELFEQVRTLPVSPKSLEHVDPSLGSLTNMNTPLDYKAALQQAGLEVPAWVANAIEDSRDEN